MSYSRIACYIRWLGIVAALAAFHVLAEIGAAAQEQPANAETGRVAQAYAKPAPDAGSPPWYASLHIGGVIVPDMTFEGTGLEIVMPLDVGIGFGGALGYKFGFGLRLETEVTYRISEASSIEFVGGSTFSDASGGLESINVMANAWYNVEFLPFLFGKWAPYFGGGAGYAKFWVDPGFWLVSGCGCGPDVAVPVIEADDTAYVWQIGGGMAYKYSEAVQVSIDYRLIQPFGRLRFVGSPYVIPLEADYKSHSVFLAFRGFF